MRWVRTRLYDLAAGVLTKPRKRYSLVQPNDLDKLRGVLRRGDVVLVDGEQRVSEVIKYLTQSSWSHSALYVGDELLRRNPRRRAELLERFGPDAEHMLVEAVMEGGVVTSPLSKYVDFNVRVCRPRGLRSEDAQRIFDEVLAQQGFRYDVKNLVDLARYFFPVSLIPRRFRRRALTFGSGLPTAVICSSLIARAFQNVGFPILPLVSPTQDPPPSLGLVERVWRRRSPYPAVVFHRQVPAVVTPRDFDLSPYFDVVKFNAVEVQNFDYRRIRWA
jgi:hypothetical protein